MPEKEPDSPVTQDERLRMTTDIVASFVGNNSVAAEAVADVIRSVYTALSGLDGAQAADTAARKPAVPVGKSITPDAIICLEDGKKLKMLKRHLRTAYNMTPAEYRAKWRLPANYPMVAPNYAKQRSKFAKKIGLGRKPRGSR